MTQLRVHRNYVLGAFLCSVAYLAVAYGAKVAIKGFALHGLALDLLALLPAIPFTGYFFVFARYLRDIDEYRRHRTVQALLMALAIVLSVSAGWDFLQVYGGAPAPQPFTITTGFILLFSVIQGVQEMIDAIARRR